MRCGVVKAWFNTAQEAASFTSEMNGFASGRHSRNCCSNAGTDHREVNSGVEIVNVAEKLLQCFSDKDGKHYKGLRDAMVCNKKVLGAKLFKRVAHINSSASMIRHWTSVFGRTVMDEVAAVHAAVPCLRQDAVVSGAKASETSTASGVECSGTCSCEHFLLSDGEIDQDREPERTEVPHVDTQYGGNPPSVAANQYIGKLVPTSVLQHKVVASIGRGADTDKAAAVDGVVGRHDGEEADDVKLASEAQVADLARQMKELALSFEACT